MNSFLWFCFFGVIGLLALVSFRQSPAPKSNQKTIVFDFDGTLCDSVPVLVDVLSVLSDEFDYQKIDKSKEQELRMMSAKSFILNELKIPMYRILYFEKRARQEALKRADKLVLFDGVKEVIEKLQAKGYCVGILSSNSKEAIAQVLEREQVKVDFIYSGSSIFGKHKILVSLLKARGLSKECVVYVGDELRDSDACKKVGIKMVAVGWGFNVPEAFAKIGMATVSTPSELLQKCVIA